MEKEMISEKSKFIIIPESLAKDETTFIDGNDKDDNQIDNIEEKTSRKGFCGKYAGILLTVLSALIFCLGALIVKYLKGYHPFTLSLYRLQGILWPSVGIVGYAKCGQKKDVFQPVWPLTHYSNLKNVLFILIRGAAGCAGFILHFYCLKYLTIADTLIIGCLRPFTVILVSHLLLGEKTGIFSLLVAVLTVLGAGIILRPPILSGNQSFDDNILIGFAYGFASILVTTFNNIIIRHLRKVHFSIVLLGYAISGTIMTLVLSISFGVLTLTENIYDTLYVIALATIALAVQTLTVLSLKWEKAGIISVVRTTEIVFAMILQFVFLGVIPDIFSVVGGAIVMIGIILTAWCKWISSLSMDHPSRNKYHFVLR